MKIYRHCFSHAELHSGDPAPLIDTFNSLGFVQRDGSKIVWDPPQNHQWYQDFLIRYSLDTKNKVYGFLPVRIREGGSSSSRADQVYIHLSNNGDYYPFTGAYKDWISYTHPVHLIFIPLKDNGFYLNVAQDGHNELINCSYTTLPILHPLGQRDYTEGSFCANFIGLPPSGNQTDWTYLTFTNFYNVPSYDGSGNRSGGHNIVDFGSSNTTNCPFFSNINNYNTLYNVKQYININQNICSLIRMPYNTNFINNLYLLATAPGQVKPGTFFSFGGRNFLNVIANYVVELPSD